MELNLNMLFIDQIGNFAHLLTKEKQTKQEFLDKIKTVYSIGNTKTELFYQACNKSVFETIRLDNNSVLLNQ